MDEEKKECSPNWHHCSHLCGTCLNTSCLVVDFSIRAIDQNEIYTRLHERTAKGGSVRARLKAASG